MRGGRWIRADVTPDVKGAARVQPSGPCLCRPARASAGYISSYGIVAGHPSSHARSAAEVSPMSWFSRPKKGKSIRDVAKPLSVDAMKKLTRIVVIDDEPD